MNMQPGLAQSLRTGADLPGQQGCAGGLEPFSVSEQAPIGLISKTAATSVANRILIGAFIGWLSTILLHAKGQSALAGLGAARFLVSILGPELIGLLIKLAGDPEQCQFQRGPGVEGG